MDGQRFDRFTKALGARSSRRSVLKGIAGGASAGLLVLLGIRDAGASASDGRERRDCVVACKQRFRGRERGQCIRACSQGDGAGTSCGTVTCRSGQVCCNASCGICTEPGGSCIQQFCG